MKGDLIQSIKNMMSVLFSDYESVHDRCVCTQRVEGIF